MKIAIASVGDKVDSLVSDEGGRAPYYLIFEDKELVEVWSNPMRTGGGGAGFGVVAALSDLGVEKVVVGKIGGNMRQALLENGVDFLEKSGVRVAELISALE